MAQLVLLLSVVLMVGIIRGQGALIMLASLLLVTALGSTFWSRRSLDGLTYRRSFEPPRIFPGETTDYVVEITNRKLLPLPWVRLEEHMPATLKPTHGGPQVSGEDGWQRRRTLSLGWNERVELRQSFTCSARGDYVVGPTELETGDPLGLFPNNLRVPESRELLVYPRIAELEPYPLQSRFPFGAANARPPVLEDPIRVAGVRDYRPSDPMRLVDWKATARRMKLQTRVLAPTTLNNVVVVLNAQTLPFVWQGYDLTRFEAVLGVAAALVRETIVYRQSVGVAANASGAGMEDFQLYLRPNRRPSQLEDTLAALATLTPIPTMAFGSFLERIAANFPFGASLVAVTAFLDEGMTKNLERLAERGHSISLVFLGAELPLSVGSAIRVRHVPEVKFESTDSTRSGPEAQAGSVEAMELPGQNTGQIGPPETSSVELGDLVQPSIRKPGA